VTVIMGNVTRKFNWTVTTNTLHKDLCAFLCASGRLHRLTHYPLWKKSLNWSVLKRDFYLIPWV
jgi:hypothetical protein